ncbi:MAG TPA: amidohydrolase family protein [Mycobacterium sp.]|nr:amidohydrolase family protein [Mycobacterium sp.]
MPQLSSRTTPFADQWLRKLPDFTEYRLPEVDAVGADAIMFSIDYPYESSQEAVDGFERTALSPGDREKIAHANAERILKI